MNKIINVINEEINIILAENNKKGKHKFVDHDKESKQNKNINSEDENEIRNTTDTDMLNIAALARKVYPDHTPEGAQSQLRKKIKGLKNDNGSEYHIKRKEAETVRKELSKL